MMCDNCAHNNVCCDEGKDDGLTFCADFMEKHNDCSGITNEEEQYFRNMLSLVCGGCVHCWDAEKCKECLFSKLSERAIEALKERPHGEWILCSERLPERDEKVLVSFKTGRVHLCKYLDDGSENPWWSYIDDCCAWTNIVCAWMPLPEPYEERR